MPGLDGLSCKSKAVVLTAFCSFAGQPGEAVGECIGDAEFHDSTP